MGHRSWNLALFFLFFFFGSGLGTAKILRNGKNQEFFSSSELGTQLDDVPIVNPTTPGTGNPYPTAPQAPDTTGQTPTTPQAPDTTGQTPTTPNTNPTTPTTTPTTPTPTTPSSSGGGQWCVASQGASDTALQVALDYACGYGGADCSTIQSGASCYNPNTVRDHASYAFNDYYQKNPAPTSCVFGGTATLTSNDPSNGNCHYASASAKTTSLSPPISISPPSPPTPIMTPTPPDMTMPGGPTDFGSEPTGSPNTATSVFYSSLLLFTCGLLAWLQLANYI